MPTTVELGAKAAWGMDGAGSGICVTPAALRPDQGSLVSINGSELPQNS